MRVLYISHGDIPSRWAHSFQAMKMAEAMASQVVSLELLTAGALRRSPIHEVQLRGWYGLRNDLRVVRLPVYWRVADPFFSRVTHPRFDLAAAWYARLRSPDLVYTRSVGAGVRCVAAGLPTVIEVHGSPKAGAQQAAFEALAAAAERPALRGVVTVTEYLREQYAALGVPERKVRVWPDAVDPAAFAAAPPRDEARRRFGLPLDRPVAVYCGHLYEEKGAPCLVDAAALAPEITFCLVGGTPRDVALLRKRVKSPENVRFEGFVPNRMVPEYLAAADLLVLPNSGRFEHARATSPLKLFEYMAARRPIVATDIPALSGWLQHGENAWVAEPDSPAALAAGLRELARDPDLAARLARQARRDVASCTWERRAREILEHFAGGTPT